MDLNAFRKKHPNAADYSDTELLQYLSESTGRPIERVATDFGVDVGQNDGDFKRGMKRGWEGMKGAGAGAIGLGGALAGAEGVKEWGLGQAKQNFDRAALFRRESDDFTNIGGVGEFIDWAQGGLGELAPQLAFGLATGGAGAAIGRQVVGKAVAKEVAKTAMKRGAMAGAAAGSIGQESGSIYPEMVAEGHDEPGRALAFGMAAGALDAVPEARAIGKLFGAGVDGSVDLLRRRVGKEALKQGAFEGVTEGAQTAIERAAAYKPLDTPEAITEYINAGAVGVLGGGTVGAVTGALDRPPIREQKVDLLANPNEQLSLLGDAPALNPTPETVEPATQEEVYRLRRMMLEAEQNGDAARFYQLQDVLGRLPAMAEPGRTSISREAEAEAAGQGNLFGYTPEPEKPFIAPEHASGGVTKEGFETAMNRAISLLRAAKQTPPPPGSQFERDVQWATDFAKQALGDKVDATVADVSAPKAEPKPFAPQAAPAAPAAPGRMTPKSVNVPPTTPVPPSSEATAVKVVPPGGGDERTATFYAETGITPTTKRTELLLQLLDLREAGALEPGEWEAATTVLRGSKYGTAKEIIELAKAEQAKALTPAQRVEALLGQFTPEERELLDRVSAQEDMAVIGESKGVQKQAVQQQYAKILARLIAAGAKMGIDPEVLRARFKPTKKKGVSAENLDINLPQSGAVATAQEADASEAADPMVDTGDGVAELGEKPDMLDSGDDPGAVEASTDDLADRDTESYDYDASKEKAARERYEEGAGGGDPKWSDFSARHRRDLISYDQDLEDGVINDKVYNARVIQIIDAHESAAERATTTQKTAAEREDNRDPMAAEAAVVQGAVEGKTAFEVAEWLSENAPLPAHRLIAVRVLRQLEKLAAAGVQYDFKVAHVGDTVPRALVNARGVAAYSFGGTDKPATITVWVNGADVTGKVGTSYETVLHELIHAVLMPAVRLGNKKAANNSPLAGPVTELFAVYNAMVDTFNERVRAARAGTGSLTEFEQRVLDRNTNALSDVDEVLVTSMVNPEAQEWMESVPYKTGRTLWQAFVEAIRNFLGLTPRADTALSEVLRLADTLFDADVNEMKTIASTVGTAMSIQSPSGSKTASNVNGATNEEGMRTEGQGAGQGQDAAVDGQGRQGREEAGAQEEVRFSIAAPTEVLEPVDGAVKRVMDSPAGQTAAHLGRKVNLALLFGHQLVDRIKGLLPAAATFFETMQKKLTLREQREQKVMDVASKFFGLKANVQRDVNSFLYDSTWSQKWGYKPEWQADAVVDPEMKKRFDALPADAQAVVKDVFAYGNETQREYEQVLLATMGQELDAQLKEAVAAKDEARAAAIRKDQKKMLAERGALKSMLAGPYAPLKRFGKFMVAVKSPEYRAAEAARNAKRKAELESNPDHYYVEFYESMFEAQTGAKELRTLHGEKVDQPIEREPEGTHTTELPLQSIKRLQRAIESGPNGQKLSAQSQRVMARLASDLYVASLDSMSARHSQQRRRNIAGADRDMMRAFTSQGKSMAQMLAAIETNDALQGSLQTMRREAREGRTTEKAEALNEVLSRYAAMMETKATPVQDALMTVSSVWMLLTSPAYWITNATQPVMMSLPVMASRHTMGSSTAALWKAYADTVSALEGRAMDPMKVKSLIGRESDMLKQLMEKGRIDMTLERELGELADVHSRAGRVGNWMMGKLRMIPQRVEVMNRVATATAAYRLEYTRLTMREGADPGLAHDQATTYAEEVIQDTHGDYSAAGAPRALMQGGKALPVKLMGQFRKFQLIQLGLIAKTARQAFSGKMTPDERVVGRKALAWMLGIYGTTTGVTGLVGAKPLWWIVSSIFGDDDEKDLDLVLTRALGDRQAAQLLLRGVPAALGLDVSDRLGMGGAASLFPYTDSEPGWRDTYKNYLLTAAGPFLGGLLPRAAGGVDYMRKGEYWKGLELLTPNGVTNAMRAARFTADGVTNSKGDTLLAPEELDAVTLLFQAVGLPTTMLTERQWKSSVLGDLESKLKDQAATLRNQYAGAAKSRDIESMKELREEWQEMQAIRKRNGLKMQPLSTLLKSPQQQRQREMQAEDGVALSSRNAGFLETIE